MPYLQVDLDGKKNWPLVASGLGIPVGAVYKGFLDLWEMCWRSKSDRVGVLRLEMLFEGAKGERTAAVLVDLGFLEDMKDGLYRVRGAEKYLRISEAQKAAGKANAGNLKRGKKSPGGAGERPGSPSGSGPALTPNHPITQSPNQIKSLAPSASDEEGAVEGRRANPRHKPLVERLRRAFKEETGHEYKHQGPKDGAAINRLLSGSMDDGEIERRWRVGLKATGWKQVASFTQLDSKWNDLALPAMAATGPPKAFKPGQRVGAEDVNHGQESEITHEF